MQSDEILSNEREPSRFPLIAGSASPKRLLSFRKDRIGFICSARQRLGVDWRIQSRDRDKPGRPCHASSDHELVRATVAPEGMEDAEPDPVDDFGDATAK